jgi:nucleoside-diphosphate-sugar epimerase
MDAGGDQMKIFLAGATGVLGRRAVKALVSGGHQVTGIARSPEKASLLRSLGATPAEIDAFDGAQVAEAVRERDVVMNLATHIPAPTKAPLPSAWAENDKIRRELSNILVDAALAAGAQRYVQESIAFTYEDLGDRWIDEDTPLDTPKRVSAVRDAEAAAERFTQAGRVGVVLRFGMFYAADTTHTETQLAVAKRGLVPFPGSRDDYVSLIQLDDAATAVVAALDVPAGIYNVVDDEPLTRGEVAHVFADALGRKRMRFTPKALMAAGGAAMRMMSRSQRVSNERFKKASGWEPRFASGRGGIPVVVREMVGSK